MLKIVYIHLQKINDETHEKSIHILCKHDNAQTLYYKTSNGKRRKQNKTEQNDFFKNKNKNIEKGVECLVTCSTIYWLGILKSISRF